MVQNKECWFLKDSQVAGIIIENWYSFSAGRTYKNNWTYWSQQPSPCWCGDTTWDCTDCSKSEISVDPWKQLYCQVGCSSDRRHPHTMIKCRQPLLGSHSRMSKFITTIYQIHLELSKQFTKALLIPGHCCWSRQWLWALAGASVIASVSFPTQSAAASAVASLTETSLNAQVAWEGTFLSPELFQCWLILCASNHVVSRTPTYPCPCPFFGRKIRREILILLVIAGFWRLQIPANIPSICQTFLSGQLPVLKLLSVPSPIWPTYVLFAAIGKWPSSCHHHSRPHHLRSERQSYNQQRGFHSTRSLSDVWLHIIRCSCSWFRLLPDAPLVSRLLASCCHSGANHHFPTRFLHVRHK